MKSKFLFFTILLLFSGCATIFDITPNQSFNFSQGKKVLFSKKQHSEAKLELAQNTYTKNTPILFFIEAKSDDFILDISDITLHQDTKIYTPLSANAILNSGYNFKISLQNFNIPTPPITPNNYQPSFIFTPYGNIFFISRNYDDSYFKEAEFSRRIVFANYLKKTTLNAKEFLGGFIAFIPKDIHDGKIEIRIKIQKEEHIFSFNLSIN